jgi:MFS family permease
MTPLAAGLVLLPSGIVVVATLPFMGRLADTVRPHYAIMIGLILFALGTAPMGDADVNTPYLHIVIFGIIARLGVGFTQPFIVTTALKTLPPERLNTGAGTMNFIRQLGGALGINVWVVFFQMRTQYHSESLVATQSSDNAVSRELLSGIVKLLDQAGLPEAVREPGALHFLGEVVHAQATTLGFQDGFWVLVAVYVLGLIPAWMLGRGNGRHR